MKLFSSGLWNQDWKEFSRATQLFFAFATSHATFPTN